MSLAVNTSGPTPIAAQGASLSSIALKTDASHTGTSTATVQKAPPASESPTLKAALGGLGKQAKLQSDLQDVAAALVPSMQQIIDERPDLAMSSFDFQSDNGSIRVTSSSLSDSDKAWLQQTLNANQGLVNAVQIFHDDATSSYALWAQADGQSLSSSDTAKVSQLADKTFSFMDMFQKASTSTLQNMDPNATYTAYDGATINFHQSVNSPLSFLVFQKSNESILNGTDKSTNGSHVQYAAMKGNIFSGSGIIPGFGPSMSSHSVGLDTTA